MWFELGQLQSPSKDLNFAVTGSYRPLSTSHWQLADNSDVKVRALFARSRGFECSTGTLSILNLKTLILHDVLIYQYINNIGVHNISPLLYISTNYATHLWLTEQNKTDEEPRSKLAQSEGGGRRNIES